MATIAVHLSIVQMNAEGQSQPSNTISFGKEYAIKEKDKR
jgi:hypothetical protein